MKIVVKKLIPRTIFKAVLMACAIPYSIFLLIYLVSLLLGANIGGSKAISLSIVYIAVSPLIYGLVSVLFSISYNLLEPKFGGIQIEISDLINKKHEEL